MQEELISGEDPRAQSKKVGKTRNQATGAPWKWIAIAALVLLLGVSYIALTKHGSSPTNSDSGGPGANHMVIDGNNAPSGSGPSTQGAGGGSAGSGPQTYQQN